MATVVGSCGGVDVPASSSQPGFARGARRGLRALVATGLAVFAVVGVRPSTVAAAPVRQDPGGATAAQTASDEAVASGQSVPIPELTDPYSTTQAEPDGTFTKDASAQPARVQASGKWVDLDPTLVHNSDGSLSTVATTNPLILSGGGSAPLAQLHSAGSQLSLTWPTSLPQPTMDGPAATYAGVLPDVDLQVTADEQGGISEVLIVKTAQAAANPALDALKLAVHATNATLHDDAAGNLTATDASGSPAFHAPTPVMWDSGDHSSSSGSSDNPVDDPTAVPPPTADISPVDVDVAAGQITLKPNQAMLDDPATTYPVYIDPSFIPTSKNVSGWAWAQQANPNTSWWNTNSNGYPAVGYQGWDSSWQGQNRAFYQFSVGSLGQAHISSATLQLTEVDTGLYDCSAGYRIDVYNIGHISSSTTWNNQPGTGTFFDSTTVTGASPDNGCGTKTYRWSVTNSVAADGDGTVTYRVQAPAGHEDERNYYRRFGSNGAYAAVLSINYNWPPNVPTSLAVSPAPSDGVACNGGTVGWIGSQAGGNITLSAKVSDTDQGSGQSVGADFNIWDKGGDGSGVTQVIAMGASAGISSKTTTSNATVTKAISTGLLVDGHMYGYTARGDDGTDGSAAAAHCYFWYDTSAPTVNAPTSAEFKSDGTGTGTVRQPGSFTLTGSDYVPAGANYSKIDHFTYSFASAATLAGDGGTHIQVNPSGASASATVPYTPTQWGTQYLYVATVDNAGNQSPTTAYPFYVPDAGNYQVNPGDVDGDSRPDLLGIGDDGSLYIYRTAATSGNTHLPARALASGTDQSVDGISWGGTLIAHRSALRSSTSVDDLWALKNGTLAYYTNNIYTPGGIGAHNGAYYSYDDSVTVIPPSCDSGTSCTGYTGTWSDVRQMIAMGDVNGDGYPDLVMAKTGNGTTGTLWFYPGTATPGLLGAPQRIGTSGWDAWDLISPGDSTGDGIPDIWARNNQSTGTYVGSIQMYRLQVSSGTVSVAAPLTDGGTSWGPASRPLITSPGDTDGDSVPELYSITNTGQLWQNKLTVRSTTSFSFNAHTVIDDGGGANHWSSGVTALS